MGSLFVVSDIHGHLDDLRASLRRAGLIDDADAWTGDDAQLWVLGDLTDRGPDGIGVLRLLRALQQQAPGSVHVLMGNHEALLVGRKLFPDSRFGEVWEINGGLTSDQDALEAEDIAWVRGLPVIGRAEGYLLMHSDTTDYLEWGSSVAEVNAAVSELLADDDAEAHWEVFASLTGRHDFAGADGRRAAQDMLSTFGGDCVVHGHSIIGSLIGVPSEQIQAPIAYADGTVVAIDGGRYDGGPLLVVQLS
ncbi:MAG TPA: metallophosphoesterase family protein [Nocardioidaceae bacterium]|nr:metallophosphoesterase family protein [Nocardioidaceae bacterium]